MQGISIRFLASRTGITASALRYYETRGLLKPQRNRTGQRRYPRSDIRRVSIVIIAQKCGFRLCDIKKLLAPLSKNRSPTAAKWALVSQANRAELSRKKQQATNLRDQLESSIGCGCLSMNACHLFNAQDHLAKQGAGSMRFAMQAPPLPASDSD
jgi:MerR family transcriptional regulator, redox-sensitive transcriptional activator SoxR